MFARTPLPAGTPASRLGGRLVTDEELRDLLARPDRPYVDTITVADDLHLVLPPGRPNGKGNHGCDPNLWWDAPFTWVTRRDVAAGEELTNDYATSTGTADFAMACGCGSARCRRIVTGDGWRLTDLQDRYGNHWVSALLTRIKGRSPSTHPD
ncbi:SET domain-containing protein-lysine N-methyltransferase [Micromonospora sp. RP3T]|uniref:SET domain-containing protein-lysine N-methyltransferase n=1 Tax=Micromonospora sp. RP3T TaxID=2135446 RepID=UPI000D17BCEE